MPANLSQALQLAPGFERRQLLERLGFDAATNDPAAALSQLESLTGIDRTAFLRGAFEKIATLAPKDALSFVKKIGDGPNHVTALKALASAWRDGEAVEPNPWMARQFGIDFAIGSTLLSGDNKRPELAVAWAKELLSGDAHSVLLGDATEAEAQTDPQRALAFGDSLTGRERDWFLNKVARGWATSDPDAAWTWAAQPADSTLREMLEASVVYAWADSDPRAAAERVGQLAVGQDRTRAISAIAESWARTDTQAALNWLKSLTDPAEQKAALTSLRTVAPVGIGASLEVDEDGYPQISGLVPGGPASATGLINAEDRIAAIDKGNGQFVDVRGLNMRQIIEMIRGDVGSSLRLQIIPPGATSPTQWKTVDLVRNQIIYKQP